MPRPDPSSAPEITPDFGWPRRARLLFADLFVFDPQRLAWRLAIRTMIGLIIPLELAHLLALPALSWAGIGAYLVAIGDSTDDGDRRQTLRLVVGSVLGGLALASGVLAGAALVLAVILMIFWGALAGLIGVYGNAFATMGLPVAWAYVELGLPVHDHSLASAARLGALFTLGGAITLLSTVLFRIAGPYAPLKRQTEACFRVLASYLDRVAAGREDDPRALVSSETNVRAAIAEARRIAGALRRGQHGWSLVAQRLLVLIEIAERLFARAALLREGAGLASAPPSSLAFFADTARQVADALAARVNAQTLRVALARLEPMTAHGEETADIARQTHEGMAIALAHAIRITLGDEMPEPVPVPPSPSETHGLSAWLAPLTQCLDPESVVARHALRFGIVAAIAVIIFWFFPSPFGYWIPLTVTVVLKPYAGATLARTVQRIFGTGAGILVSAALMPFLAGPQAELAAVFIFFFCMMLVLPFNYSLAIFFLSAGLIPFEHFLSPGVARNVALMRLAGTSIGAVLAIVGGHLLWPSFERKTLPFLLKSSIASMAVYTDRVLAKSDQASYVEAHRLAGRDTTNLQAAVQRSASEIGGDAEMMAASALAASALQRLFISLNAVATAVPASAAPAMEGFRKALVATLRNLAGDGGGFPALCAGALPSGFLGYELSRMVSEVTLLRTALDRLANHRG
ncbi:MAG TPA: FUSC family protein [Acetobacteraceae bacterium]|nr:FUSC family protein [Acetobacteraceae bacterium]